MANLETEVEIDWTACELIERVPGKFSGRPVVRGTRILPEAIVNSYELGETIDELREGFPSLSVEQIMRLIEFAQAQRSITSLYGAMRGTVTVAPGVDLTEPTGELWDAKH